MDYMLLLEMLVATDMVLKVSWEMRYLYNSAYKNLSNASPLQSDGMMQFNCSVQRNDTMQWPDRDYPGLEPVCILGLIR